MGLFEFLVGEEEVRVGGGGNVWGPCGCWGSGL